MTSAHRCAWCRSKLAGVTPLPITGSDRLACKATCRGLEEDRIRRGESRASAQNRRKHASKALARRTTGGGT